MLVEENHFALGLKVGLVKEVKLLELDGNVKTIIMAFKMKSPLKACWKSYVQKGVKKKGNRTVPNCVPRKKK